jgi:hypothetical protein
MTEKQQGDHSPAARHAAYLRRAEEAETLAGRVASEFARKDLEAVAAGWRRLAASVSNLLRRVG